MWGYVYGLAQYTATHTPNPTIPTKTVTHSTDTPDETPPQIACNEYTVSGTAPRKIEIPAAGVSGCVQKVGIDQHKAIAVPDNIHLAGWYVNSVPPGEKGLSIIDGHVLGRYGDAIFANLKNLRQGDNIKIQLGDLSWREFIVKNTEVTSDTKAGEAQFTSLPDVASQLTLITCQGKYDAKTNSYDKRLIVRAALVE